MATFADMVDRIGVELMAGGRTDLEDQVKAAIVTAVAHYRGRRFWFNEGVDDTAFPTVIGQAAYDLPASVLILDTLRIDRGSGFFELERVSWRRMQQLRAGSQSNGSSYCYAEYGGQVWLWQIPSAVWDLECAGLLALDPTPLSADDDENAWTNEGEELIRQRARAIVQIDVLKDSDARQEASTMRLAGGVTRECLSPLEAAALKTLVSESNRRRSTGRIRRG